MDGGKVVVDIQYLTLPDGTLKIPVQERIANGYVGPTR
jgi:hypothetical protein